MRSSRAASVAATSDNFSVSCLIVGLDLAIRQDLPWIVQRSICRCRSSIYQQRQQSILTFCFLGIQRLLWTPACPNHAEAGRQKHVKPFLCPTLKGNILENSYVFFKHKIFCNKFTSILHGYQMIQGPTAAAAAVPVRESLRAGSPAPTIYPNKGIQDLGFKSTSHGSMIASTY